MVMSILVVLIVYEAVRGMLAFLLDHPMVLRQDHVRAFLGLVILYAMAEGCLAVTWYRERREHRQQETI